MPPPARGTPDSAGPGIPAPGSGREAFAGRIGPPPARAAGEAPELAAGQADPDPAGGRRRAARPAAGVLADRLAAVLLHHEPGWRLPRHTALARRFNVSTAQIDAAIADLAGRRLISRLPDGQLYRASPAEYLISLSGVPGLGAQVDPMGAHLACGTRTICWRRAPEAIACAMAADPAQPLCVIRVKWTADGTPAALATTYLAPGRAAQFTSEVAGAAAAVSLLPPAARPGRAPPAGGGQPAPEAAPAALHIELLPPPPSVARSLRLSPGQPAAAVTVRFDDPLTGRPAALTVAALRPEVFRVVVRSASLPLADDRDGGFAGIWTHLAENWDP